MRTKRRKNLTSMCQNLIPLSNAFTCLPNRSNQFMHMPTIQAPIEPNIPPNTLMLKYSKRKMTLSIMPPTAGMMNSITVAATL